LLNQSIRCIVAYSRSSIVRNGAARNGLRGRLLRSLRHRPGRQRNSLPHTLEVTTADHIQFGTDWSRAPEPSVVRNIDSGLRGAGRLSAREFCDRMTEAPRLSRNAAVSST
jgi:hypothetical protein